MQVNVHKYGPEGGVDLMRAMSTIYNETRAFLIHNYDITEDMVSIDIALMQQRESCKIVIAVKESKMWQTITDCHMHFDVMMTA